MSETKSVSEGAIKALTGYFDRRIAALDFCNRTIENAILDQKSQIENLANTGTCSLADPETQRGLGRLSGPIPSTSRNCMLITVCCLLEDLLRRAGNIALVDYDVVFKQDKKEHHEHFLATHLRAMKTKAGINFVPVQEHVDQLEHAILIRNSIVHAWGKVETSQNPDRLRDTLGKVSWAEESGDGYIVLDDQAYADVMQAVIGLVRHVFTQLRSLDRGAA